MRRVASWLLVAALAAVLLTLSGSAVAAPGDLDPTFGTGGVVTTELGLMGGSAVAVQEDGSIVVGGTATVDAWVIVRYLPDGSIDESFGDGGKVITPVRGGWVHALAIGADGTIVGAGLEVARYLRDGTLDLSYGTDGKVSLRDNLTVDNDARDLVLMPDGSALLAGTHWSLSPSPMTSDFMLARLMPNGAFDTTFGNNGKVVTDNGSAFEFAAALVVQPDGRLVAVGEMDAGTASDIVLVRYLPDGRLDPTFGSGGKVITDIGGPAAWDHANDAVLTEEGKLIVVGASSQKLTLVRYLSDGSLDSSFGTGGILISALNGYGGSIAQQADGKLVVTISGGETGRAFAAARFNRNGDLDESLGEGGVAHAQIAGGGTGLALQWDGKVIVVGSGDATSGWDFVLVRYLGDESPANTVAPLLTGSAQAGATLVAASGEWVGTDPSFSYRWQRCDPAGEQCVEIAGATGSSLVLGAADVGFTLRVAVTAVNGAGSATAFSLPTGVVTAAPPPSGGGGGGGALPDLELTMSADRATAALGETVLYRLQVRLKNGTFASAATGVVVTDALPAGVELVSTKANRGPGCSGTSTVVCPLDFISGPIVGEVEILVRVTSAGTLVNTATVTAKEADPDGANNSASVTVAGPSAVVRPVALEPPRLTHRRPATTSALRAVRYRSTGIVATRVGVDQKAALTLAVRNPRTGKTLLLQPGSRLASKTLIRNAASAKAAVAKAGGFAVRAVVSAGQLVRGKPYQLVLKATAKSGTSQLRIRFLG